MINKKNIQQNVENFSLSLEFRFGLSKFFDRIPSSKQIEKERMNGLGH